MPTATDVNRLAMAHTPLGRKLFFREMSGHEELSRPFEYRLEVWAEDDSAVDPKALLGRSITAEIEIKGNGSRFIDGQCTRFAYIGTEGSGRRDTRYYRYEARLSPWIFYMGLQSTSRVFQNVSVPDILSVVFAKYSEFSVEFSPTREYRVWEYCVQYQETDLNFMMRLCEHEGIYYYFKHELGRHTLMLCDDMGAHPVLPYYAKIPHMPPDKIVVPTEEYIDNLRMAQEVDVGNFYTKDYDLKHPSADLKALNQQPMSYPHGSYEIFDWPGNYVEVKHGEQYARLRLEELQHTRELVTGQTTARGVTPGYRFTLERCARRDQNREYLIRSVDTYFRDNSPLSGGGGADWSLTFVAQPTSFPYRPPRLTPKPYAPGPQTAIVVGLKDHPDEEIVCDEYGRVRVQFHWDREHNYNEESSCWMRISNAWAGSNWGSISLPRVGQEVIVDFLNGDCDYPIIVGRVYNAEHKTPYDLPRWKEYSTWKSRSTKKGGNNDWNEIRYYDYKGKEQVFIHCQRRWDVRVKWSSYITVKESYHLLVGTELHTIYGDYNLHVGGKWYVEVDSDLDFYAKGNIKVGTASDIRMSAVRIDVSANRIVLDAKDTLIFRVNNNFVKIDASGVTIQGTMTLINCGGGAPPAVVADIDGPLDAEPADTGEPGYLDRPYHGSGGGGRKHWDVYNGSGLDIGGGKTAKVFRNDDGSVSVGKAIKIKPSSADPKFTDKVLDDLGNISSTPSGRDRLGKLDNSGHTVNIERINNGANSQEISSNDADASKAGVPSFNGGSGTSGTGTGRGSDSTVQYNPDFKPPTTGPDPAHPLNPPQTVPSDDILFHELGHSEHGVGGQQDSTPLPAQGDGRQFDNNEEKATTDEENKYRSERGIPQRFDHHNL